MDLIGPGATRARWLPRLRRSYHTPGGYPPTAFGTAGPETALRIDCGPMDRRDRNRPAPDGVASTAFGASVPVDRTPSLTPRFASTVIGSR